MSKVMEAYQKHREALLYIIVGGLTTAVNFIVYFLCTRQFGISNTISNGIGWVFAVAFAYFADKIIVFQANSFDFLTLLKEIVAFVLARLATGIIDMSLFYIFNGVMGFNDIVIKVFINIFVIIGNYLFSKFVIFKQKK